MIEQTAMPFHISYLGPRIKQMILEHESGIKDLAVFERIPGAFWTVGTTTYKDGVIDKEKIHKSNRRLIEEFPWFYRFQLEYIRHIYQAPAKYMADMPLPGFHVFKYIPEFEKPLARPHVDVPYNKYDWGKEIGEGDIFTHVIGVEIPRGAGMYMWNLNAHHMARHGADKIVELARKTKPDLFVPHAEDRMIVHSGMNVHMIKPFEEPTTKWRITLQSHAVWKDNTWQLYW